MEENLMEKDPEAEIPPSAAINELSIVTPVRAWPPFTVLTLSDIDEWAALK
jgi:hypothetical protein